MSVSLLSGKVFLLVTGASQGIGRQITESFTPLLGEGSSVLILARNAAGLEKTASNLPKGLKVHTKSVDLSIATADQLKVIIREALGPAGASQFEKAVVVHNAGSIGDVSKLTTSMTDFRIWRDYYDLNVFSTAVLNGVFMELFNVDKKITKLVINITSLCGVQPFKTMGYYCSGKAAREMFFKVFAAEYPDVNVLNYSPGPVETDMLQILRENLGDTETRKEFVTAKENRLVLTTEQTVSRLIDIIKLQKYKSGDHVDYFDDI